MQLTHPAPNRYQDDPDWVQVRDGHGRTGFVPRNYVEIQAAAPAPAPAHTPPPAPSMGKKPSLVQASPPGNQGRGAGVSVPQKAASAPVATNSMRGDTQASAPPPPLPCPANPRRSVCRLLGHTPPSVRTAGRGAAR